MSRDDDGRDEKLIAPTNMNCVYEQYESIAEKGIITILLSVYIRDDIFFI